jgi:iron complex transport system substrate-binding protein
MLRKNAIVIIAAAVVVAVIIAAALLAMLPRPSPKPSATPEATPEAPKPKYPLTITDSAGRSVTFERPPARIIAQSYAAWILVALNATDMMVGAADSAIRDPLLKHRLPMNVTGVGEFFGPGAKVSIEKILELNPDLVIAPTSYPAGELEAKLPPHIKVLRLDFWGVSNLFDEVEKLALLVNKTAEARRLIAKYKAVLEEIDKAVAGAERPAVYYEWYSDYNTVGRLNEWHNAVEMSGGRNIFGDLEQYSVRVSPEAVVARNPAVIIRREHERYFNPCFANSTRRLEEVARAIAERPGWASIRAVREGRVYVISAAYQNGFGVIAHVAAIAKALHPDRLRGVDPDGLMLEWLRDVGVLQYCTGVRQWVYPSP